MLKQQLEKRPIYLTGIYAALISFATYSCMYAFRKPFSAASFDANQWMGIDYKILLVIAQVMGYTLSKFIGVKVISELKKNQRVKATLILIGIAQLALLGFGMVPKPWHLLMMFFNGLPLGMIWGIVFSYLEGRKNTEVLGAVLCVSFIFSSDFVKTVGRSLMANFDLSEFWMPAVTGLVFLLPLVLFIHLLNQTPDPTKEDIAERKERLPMTKKERRAYISKYFLGLSCLFLAYIIITILRDFKDNFASNLWDQLGYADDPAIFTLSSLPVSFLVLGIMASVFFIRKNIHALWIIHLIIIVGFTLTGFSTLLYLNGIMSPLWWMISTGIGIYMAYIPFNGILFDRLIALFPEKGNVGFFIYLADSLGYLGSVSILLLKNFMMPTLSWVDFFAQACIYVSITGGLISFGAILYFAYKRDRLKKKNTATEGVRLAMD